MEHLVAVIVHHRFPLAIPSERRACRACRGRSPSQNDYRRVVVQIFLNFIKTMTTEILRVLFFFEKKKT